MTQEQFEILWELCPTGSKETAYYITRNFLDTKTLNTDNKIITYELLVEMYREYVAFLEPYQKGAYTKKGYEMQPIDDYLDHQLFLKSYKAPKKSRDAYLFGEYSDPFLKKRIKEFNGKFKKNS